MELIGPIFLIIITIAIVLTLTFILWKKHKEGNPTPSPEIIKLINAYQKIGSAILEQFEYEDIAAKRTLIQTYTAEFFASIDKYSRKDNLDEKLLKEFLEWRKTHRLLHNETT